MTIKNKETLEKLRTYQIGVIRSVIASRQGRLKTYLADATDRERLADTDGLAYEEYYESPLTIRYDGLYRNVISLEFCEDGLTPVCLMDGGDDFPLPLENLSCDTLQSIVEWLKYGLPAKRSKTSPTSGTIRRISGRNDRRTLITSY